MPIAFPKPTKKIKKRKRIPKQSSMGKLKKTLEDLVKLQAKKRDNFICQKCGKQVEGSNAQGSHVIPVSASDYLRFDILNIKCLCLHCHLYWWHKNPLEASKWFQEKFPERYIYLQERRYIIHRWTRDEIEGMIAVLKRTA